MSSLPTRPDDLRSPTGVVRAQRLALVVGAAGVLACGLGALHDAAALLRAWLVAELLWVGVAFGALALIMLHQLTRGTWGLLLRRVLEAAARTLPVLALLFIPLLAGLRWLYPWARPEDVAQDPLLAHRAPWMSVAGWIARSALFLGAGWWLASSLARLSRRQQERPEQAAALARRQRMLSAAGLVAYGLLASLAAVDWLMSLETGWTSSVYGMVAISGQMLSALAFAVAAVLWLAQRPPLRDVVGARDRHDWGNLLLVFVMLWAYIAFSQYLLVWSANLPDEVTFYLHRQGGWLPVTVALALLRFAVPFAVLLSRRAKRSASPLAAVALLLLATQWLDLFWLVAPAFSPGRFALGWLDIVAPFTVGAFFVAAFARALASRALLPLGDPALPEVPPDA